MYWGGVLSDHWGLWPDSAIPDKSPARLIVDGFWSQSDEKHLYYKIESKLIKGSMAKAFSYSEPNRRYFGDDTSIDLRADPERLIRAYDDVCTFPLTYLCFSLGGALVPLGYAAKVSSGGVVYPRCMILIQPALAVNPSMLALAADRWPIHSTILDLTDPDGENARSVLASIRKAASVTNMLVVIWQEDQLLTYTAAAIAVLKTTQAQIALVRPKFPNVKPRRNPFVEEFDRHRSVPHEPETIEEVIRFLEKCP